MKKFRDSLKTLFLYLRGVKGLKYVIVTILAVVFIGFVDEDSVWHHYQNKQRIDQLQEEIDLNLAQYNYNNERLEMLNNDTKAVQKIARERYFMKADDEDIFVLSDDKQTFLSLDHEDAE